MNQQKKGAKILEKSDVLFRLSYLPPLSDFVPFCLTPPPPPKIGHHLCMFPNIGGPYIFLAKDNSQFSKLSEQIIRHWFILRLRTQNEICT